MMNVQDRLTEMIGDLATARQDAEKILAEFIVIHRDELPVISLSVDDQGELLIHEGDREYYAGGESTRYREIALKDLAISELLASYEEVSAEHAKRKRRDELARDLCCEAYGEEATVSNYQTASNITQRAIDRIIELEQAQP